MHISRTLALGLLFFTLSWLSFDHYRPWINFHAEMLAFMGLFVLLASVLMKQSARLVLPQVSIWMGAVSVLPWVQFVFGINDFAGDALMSSLYLSGLLAAACIGYCLSSNTSYLADGLTGLMHSLWVAAMVSAAIGLAQWFNVEGPLGMYVVQSAMGDRAMGNLGQANQLATLLLMGMAAFAYVFERKIIGRFTFFLGMGLMTAVLILTQSRAGMLSVLMVTAYLMWKRSVVNSRLSMMIVAGWATCFLLGTLLLPYLSEALLLSEVRGVNSIASVSQRWRIWQQLAYGLTQSPWLGYGWNQSASAIAAGAIAYPGSVPFTYAHNLVLDMMAWNGLPSGILLTVGVAYWCVTRLWLCSQLHAVYAVACLLPMAVHSMLEYPFAYAYFLIAAGLMIGVVEAAHVPAKTFVLNMRWAWGFFALWVSIGSYLTVEYFSIEEDFRVVRFENLNLGRTEATYQIPRVWMISHLAAMLKARRQIIEPNMRTSDLENLRTVSQRFADNIPRFRYALALALNGDDVGANHQLAMIRGMFGDDYYAACMGELRHLQKEKYPQLSSLTTN